MTETAICYQCKEVRPVGSFQLFKRKYRARLCNVCHWQKYGPKQNGRRTTDDGRKKRAEWNRSRERSETCKARERRHGARYADLYPAKTLAKLLVTRAIKAGALVRPDVCSVCHQDPGRNRRGAALIHAHHDDYSKPLDVRWMCISCHTLTHRGEEAALKAPSP